MDRIADLPAKLDMALKAMSLSRVALAQRLEVDKSLVGRWLSGSIHPTEHNLVRLTSLAAETIDGFRLADWYADLGAFAQRLGVEMPSSMPFASFAGGEALSSFLEAARPELEHRGSVYEGFWRTSRPSLLMPDQVFHDYGMIRRTPGGLIEVVMEGAGLDFRGWLFPISGNVFVFIFDKTGRSPMSLIFKGVSLPKAMVLDGILLMAALDPSRTPVAVPILLERVGDLSGDEEADREIYARIVQQEPIPDIIWDEGDLERHLVRNFGPDAAAVGGDPFLAVGSRHLSRGATLKGLRG